MKAADWLDAKWHWVLTLQNLWSEGNWKEIRRLDLKDMTLQVVEFDRLERRLAQ